MGVPVPMPDTGSRDIESYIGCIPMWVYAIVVAMGFLAWYFCSSFIPEKVAIIPKVFTNPKSHPKFTKLLYVLPMVAIYGIYCLYKRSYGNTNRSLDGNTNPSPSSVARSVAR